MIPATACLNFAVLQAISLVRSTREAREVERRGGLTVSWKGMSAASRWLQMNVKTTTLVRVKEVDGIPPGLGWLASQRSDTLVAWIRGRGGVGHVVCVSGSLQLIFDCKEATALRLSREALDHCCGENSAAEMLMEVRIVRDLQPGKAIKKQK